MGFGSPNLDIIAGGHVNAVLGAAPVGRGFVSIARTGGVPAGSWDITLEGGGIDTTNYVMKCTERGATVAAGSLLSTFNIVDVTDTVKRVQSLREGAAGVASALADINFDFILARAY